MKKKGFTLLEVLLSFAIVAILVVPISNMILATVKNTKVNQEKQQARLLGQETIEQIKALDVIKNDTFLLSNGVEIKGETNGDKRNISGIVGNFAVEGNIKFNSSVEDDNDKLLKTPISCLIDFDNDGYVYSDNDSVQSYISSNLNLSRVKSDELSIKIKTPTIYINSKDFQKSRVQPIVVLISQDISSKPIDISIENLDSEQSDIYILGKNDIDVEKCYKVKSIKGNVSIYNNKIYSNRQTKGVYSIDLAVKKGSEVLQKINAQKTVK